MCIRDRYQRRVHGDNRPHIFKQANAYVVPTIPVLILEMVKLLKIEEHDSSSPAQSPLSTSTSAPKKKYIKLTAAERQKLLDRVFFNQIRIKEAAKELRIHYSTAKKIVEKHRHRRGLEGFCLGPNAAKTCSFSQDVTKASNYVKIISTVGGLTTDNVAVKLMTTGDAFDTLDRMRRCSFMEIASLPTSSAGSSPNSASGSEPFTPVTVNNWIITHTILSKRDKTDSAKKPSSTHPPSMYIHPIIKIQHQRASPHIFQKSKHTNAYLQQKKHITHISSQKHRCVLKNVFPCVLTQPNSV
eukprot:TRINITY_DN2392_c0_g1_i2.p1 TRINITY_DN2392_c0_g1~~TRINITY_DN2392_c0_g1_i2.p1  ORF type:complete len:349 (+),score=103.94 TRINITY_DN2392_c0_g1_i2:153-1049(+)